MNKLDLIEKYIQRKATAEELDAIDRLMAEDAGFKEELMFELELQEAVRRKERAQFKQQLQGLEKKQTVNRLVPLMGKIAAALVVGVGLLWFFNQSPSFDKLYASHFEAYPNIVAPTVRDYHVERSRVEEAFEHYDNRQYDKATPIFEKLYQEDKLDYANFYYAISLMADQKVEEGIKALEDPAWTTPEKYHYQKDWYLALGYMKLGNKDKSIIYLKKVIPAGGAKAEQAREILTKIE
jgi:tetratricopeptide (TPR) repeat protein